MRGSLRKLGPNRWQLRVYAGVDPATGRKRQLGRVHHGGKRSAEDALRDLIAEVEAGRARPERHVTVAELLQAHIEHRSSKWSANTLADRRRISEREIVPELGGQDIRRVRPLDVERLTQRIAETRPPTAQKVKATLSAAYADAMRWEWVDRNPARIAEAVSVPKRTDTAPDLVDVSAPILAAIAVGDIATAVLARTAVTTGCRRGELAALRWSDLDLDQQLLTVSRAVSIDRVSGPKAVLVEGPTKTHNRKRISLDAGTTAWLKALRQEQQDQAGELEISWDPNGFVWARRPDGREPWWPDTMSHRWHRLATDAGMPNVRLHDLRHAMVGELVRSGFDVTIVSGRAGHASKVVTLDTYAHELPDRDRPAAEHLGRLLDG